MISQKNLVKKPNEFFLKEKGMETLKNDKAIFDTLLRRYY